ncbi:fructose-bisphosphatase class II [Escherichia coli]|nr:fructose-bisphosphatase class II [Escherichia coli]
MMSLAWPLFRVTEQAALAAWPQTGCGDKNKIDGLAVTAMRQALNDVAFRGRLVIGEGEIDHAPMLWIGEEVGKGDGPEGVISACAVKALGGDMQAELIDFCQAKGDYTENRQIAEQERKRCKAMGVDVNRVYSLDELVRGNDILFSATGVTGGELVNGIQQTANGVRTQTLLIGGADQTCNIIDSLH